MSYTIIFIFIVSILNGLAGSEPGLLSQFRRWLNAQRACASDCPEYLDHVCGFDSHLGYIVAENMCLFVKYNLCQRTSYEVIEGEVCERLLNVTIQPPLVFVSQGKPLLSQVDY